VAGNNKIAQVMKMMGRMQTRIEESEKKWETMITALQNLTKESHGEKSE